MLSESGSFGVFVIEKANVFERESLGGVCVMLLLMEKREERTSRDD